MSGWLRRRSIAVVVAVAAITAGIPAAMSHAQGEAGEAVPPLPQPIVGGYLLADTPRFDRIRMDLVTHFFWAFSLIKDGRCTPASQAGIDAVLAERRVRPDLRVIRSIGGWGAGGFSAMAATEAGRRDFVSSCVAAFIANGVADGFDIDWEFPVSGGLPDIGYSPRDRINLNLLVDEFRRQLNAFADANGRSRRDFLVTAALPAGRWQDSGDGRTGAPYDTNTSFDLRTLGRTLDLINVMTYDMGTAYSPVSMFNQPLRRHPADPTGEPYNSAEGAIRYFTQHGVPRKKMALGVEFTLARGFTVTTDRNNGLYQPWSSAGCGQTRPAAALDPANTTIMINWDPEVESPYLWNPSARVFCSYENAQSLGIRSRFAKARGLNGIFSWELTGDASNSQLRAVAQPWNPDAVLTPPPRVTGRTFHTVSGREFTGTVATITGGSAESPTVIINWGDQTRGPATVRPTGHGRFTVSGTHTYTAPGRYRLTITTIDPDPLNSRMVNAHAVVGR